MHCSFSEKHLDEYVEGTLSPPDRARVAAHVATCPACAALLEEVRVIDALLVTPRLLESAPNFTFKVMAEVRSLPQPREHRLPTIAMLGTYVIFAWITIGAFLVFARDAARASFATLDAGLAHAGHVLDAVARGTGHVFGRQTFDVTAAMGGLLALDALALVALFGLYAVVRARRLSGVPVESDPC